MWTAFQKNKWLTRGIVISVFLMSFLSFSINVFSQSPSFPDDISFVSGEVIVKFKENIIDLSENSGHQAVDSFSESRQLESKEKISVANIAILESKTGESVESIINRLEDDPNVEYVQPNFQYEPFAIPTNDTHRGELWGLDNTGQLISGISGVADADMDAPEAWVISEGSSSVVVAVIDNGIAYNHPDINDNMWDGASCVDENGDALGGCIHGYDFGDSDKDPLPTTGSHGTQMAGIIAAEKNNNLGVIGLAPSAKLMAIRTNYTTADIVNGISFAEQNGVKIINMSFGVKGATCNDVDDTVLYAAIQSYSGLVVASAGNYVEEHGNGHFLIPADFSHDSICWTGLSNMISVASTNNNDVIGSNSDYGADYVDIAAPGIDIYTTILTQSYELIMDFDAHLPVVPPAVPAGFSVTNDFGTVDVDGGADWGNAVTGDSNSTPYDQTADSYFTSPIYDFSGGGTAIIDFWTRCDTEYESEIWYDYMTLEVTGDGANWSELNLGSGHGKFDEDSLDALSEESPLDETGNSDSYHFIKKTIPNNVLTNAFQFRFHWVADGDADTGSTGAGCIIDTLYIQRSTDGSDETYDMMQGTSGATAYTSGLAALLLGYNSTLTNSLLKGIIFETGDTLASLAGKLVHEKRVNAYNALNIFQPRGGFSVDDILPAVQLIQSVDGTGLMTINFKAKDGYAGIPVTLNTFEYSVDNGVGWNPPANGDSSASLSVSWNDNSYQTATDYLGTSYSFTLNTKHVDLAGLDGVDQSDVMIRFKVNDGAKDSPSVVSEAFIVDNVSPVIAEVTPVLTPTMDTTPDYEFSADEAGTIVYGGLCSSITTSAVVGNNIVTFNSLVDGVYDDCTITVADAVGNVSNIIAITSFQVDAGAPSISISAPTKTAVNTNITDITISVADVSGIQIVNVNTANSTASVGISCSQTSSTQVDCTVNLSSSGNLTVNATDDVGNVSQLSVNDFVINRFSGGGGGGGGASISSTSNTQTSFASSVIPTVTGNQTYSRPVELKESIIIVDLEASVKRAQVTEGGILTIRPNRESNVALIIPPYTELEGAMDWNGKIYPPLVQSKTLIDKEGGIINDSAHTLSREAVALIVKAGSDNSILNFSNEVELVLSVDLSNGQIVIIYSSEDGIKWNKEGTSVVKNNILRLKSKHLTYFAFEVIDEADNLHSSAPVLFTDIQNHWAEDYIKQLASSGVVNGKNEYSFSPDEFITRAELTKIAVNAFGFNSADADQSPFRDVKADTWFAPYVQSAKENGLIQGYNQHYFRPNEVINRAEALKILLEAGSFDNLFDYYNENYANKNDWWYVFFIDVPIGEWYSHYVAYAKDASVIGGYEDGTFKPANNITRAEVAKMVMKILELK